MRWQWPWKRERPAIEREPYSRIPDYDTVFPPGHPHYRPYWADLCRPAEAHPLDEPTQLLPTYRGRLFTLGALWRTRGQR